MSCSLLPANHLRALIIWWPSWECTTQLQLLPTPFDMSPVQLVVLQPALCVMCDVSAGFFLPAGCDSSIFSCAATRAAGGCLLNTLLVRYSFLALAKTSIIRSNSISCCHPQAHELQPGLQRSLRHYAPLLWGSVRVPCMQFQGAIIMTTVRSLRIPMCTLLQT